MPNTKPDTLILENIQGLLYEEGVEAQISPETLLSSLPLVS